MALDKFKRTDIIIDTIHPKLDIYTPLVAMQGEYNGRTLRVQLTNNGVVEPQTADMYFGFFHTETHQDGLYTFTKVDTNKGIYELSYPSEMLQVEGTCICQLKIVDIATGRSISLTEGFSVTVKRSIIHSGMEVAENSIKIFDKALLDIREHERRILLIEANFKDLAKMLSTNIPNIDVAISTRASQVSVNNVQSGINILNQSANNIYSKLNTGMVKRIQRGLINERNFTGSVLPNSDTGVGIYRYYKDIVIPYAVNMGKSLTLIDVAGVATDGSEKVDFACQLLNSNALRIIWVSGSSPGYALSGYPVLVWQVIEYY